MVQLARVPHSWTRLLSVRKVGQTPTGRFVLGRPLAFHTSRSSLANKKSMKTFNLADIGEGITECEVLKWEVKAPTKVEAFDVLCEVQSDKATVEITSPYEGTLSKILVEEGQIAKVGQGLCIIEVEEEEESEGKESPQHHEVTHEAPRSQDTTPPQSGLNQPQEHKTPTERRLHPLDPNYVKPSSTGSSQAPKSFGISDDKTLATPSVRHFAREKGVPRLSQLMPGSGKDGRIEKRDVEAWLAQSTRNSEPISTPPSTKTEGTGEVETIVDLGRTRRAMWKAMEKSLEIPHFGYSTILDLTALHNMLPVLNAGIPAKFNPPPPSKYLPAVSPHSILSQGQVTQEPDPLTHYNRLTFLPLLLKSLSRAMQEWPLFRSTITHSDDKPQLTIRPQSDIAIALSTPTGLYTPTITGVNRKSAYEIMGELRRLQALGRTVPNGLTVKEMPKKGATITVSNVGAIGKGEFAAPLLVPGGGVAIVAIGRAKWVQRENGNRLEVGISWSADHRVVEGAELAAFTESWRQWVEEPARMVAGGY